MVAPPLNVWMSSTWLVRVAAALLLACSPQPPADVRGPSSGAPGSPVPPSSAAGSNGAGSTGGASAPAAAPPLKIATWNLEWLYRTSHAGTVRRSDADYARLARYARLLAADIVAVQEVDGDAALRRVFDDAAYDYHVVAQSGVQRVGFAYRAGLDVTPHPDVSELDVGGLRAGADLAVSLNGRELRLLNVHLKSGCFEQPLGAASRDCTKLAAQLPVLERWIDARAAEGVPFVVLGDFNRRLRAGEPFYTELDDADPPDADLTLVTDGQPARCWNGEHRQLVDHILLSRAVAPWVLPSSFAQLDYAASDVRFKGQLSDHCALSVVLTPGVAQPAAPLALAPRQAPPAPRIKGNVGAGNRRIYHRPGCPSYDETQIDESSGERYFASEAEALAAGWRKAGNCP